MKMIFKGFLCSLIAFSLVACGSKDDTISVEKEGTKYEVDDEISFYYPNDFKIDINTSADDAAISSIEFIKDDQVIYYTVETDMTDNYVEDRSVLYEGELEEMGATNLVVNKPKLDSGLDCYVYTGEIEETGMKFDNLVYFSDHDTYIYGYQAPKKTYNENIKRISTFIESWNKATGKSK